MSKVLVVWSEVPESIDFVEIETEDIALLASFNGVYINASEDTDAMSKFFYNDKFEFLFKKRSSAIKNKRYDLIIHCGIIL